jgi:hypothetical protein
LETEDEDLGEENQGDRCLEMEVGGLGQVPISLPLDGSRVFQGLWAIKGWLSEGGRSDKACFSSGPRAEVKVELGSEPRIGGCPGHKAWVKDAVRPKISGQLLIMCYTYTQSLLV